MIIPSPSSRRLEDLNSARSELFATSYSNYESQIVTREVIECGIERRRTTKHGLLKVALNSARFS